jgi:hypothetical protein
VVRAGRDGGARTFNPRCRPPGRLRNGYHRAQPSSLSRSAFTCTQTSVVFWHKRSPLT